MEYIPIKQTQRVLYVYLKRVRRKSIQKLHCTPVPKIISFSRTGSQIESEIKRQNENFQVLTVISIKLFSCHSDSVTNFWVIFWFLELSVCDSGVCTQSVFYMLDSVSCLTVVAKSSWFFFARICFFLQSGIRNRINCDIVI